MTQRSYPITFIGYPKIIVRPSYLSSILPHRYSNSHIDSCLEKQARKESLLELHHPIGKKNSFMFRSLRSLRSKSADDFAHKIQNSETKSPTSTTDTHTHNPINNTNSLHSLLILFDITKDPSIVAKSKKKRIIMNRIIAIVLTLNTLLSTSSAFIVQTPNQQHDVRIRNSKAFVASSVGGIDISDEQVTKVKKGPRKPKITQITSAEEYMDFLLEDDKLCMVKFYAPHCKSCQKTGMHYKRIGKEIGDLVVSNKDGTESVVREGEIRLAEIEYGANRDLCKRLGITKLPTIHFYSQGKKVDGFPAGPRKLPMLLEKLAEYRSMSLEDLSFEADMNQGVELGETVLEALGSEKAKSQLDSAFC